MPSPFTGREQDALLEQLLVAAQAEARSFALRASLLVESNNLAGRVEAELSRMAQFPVVEPAGTLRQSQQALSTQSAEAERLVHWAPRNHAALRSGELLACQAKALLEVTRNTAPEVTSRVEAALLPEMLGWNPADVRRRAAAMVLPVESELDLERGTDHVADRLAAARANRRVTVRPEPDGMAALWATLPAEKAIRFRQNLDELARRARLSDADAGIVRTADQRRADLLVELPGLMLRGQPVYRRPTCSGAPAERSPQGCAGQGAAPTRTVG